MWEQLVEPNLSASRPAGWCLAFAQDVYGAPVRYRSAWDAWLAVPDKHSDPLPNVSVCCWMSHWGTYQGEYANWGHVVAYVPSKGFLSSPASGVGQQWFATIEQVERTFNAKYVGWSESLNGLKIVKEVSSTISGDEMKLIQYNTWNYLVGNQYIERIITTALNNSAIKLYGQPVVLNSFDEVRATVNCHGVAYSVWETLNKANPKGDYAWSVERGFFNPESAYTPSPGGGVNLAAVAKAVNDDVAVRMAR